MKKTVFILLVLCTVSLLVSCAGKGEDNTGDRYDENTAYRGAQRQVYQDVFYMYNPSPTDGRDHLEYYMLPSSGIYDGEDTIYPQMACSDPLCSHTTNECPAYCKGDFGMLVVDREASEKKGSPILIVNYGNMICRYDIAASRRIKLVDMDDGIGQCQSLWLYKDYMFAVGSGYGANAVVYRVDKDTGKHMVSFQPDFDDNFGFTIIGFYDNYLYFRNPLAEIWRLNLDLEDLSLVMRGECDYDGQIKDGYLYYCRDVKENDYFGACFLTVSLYRRKLGTTDGVFAGKEEFIDSDIAYFVNPQVFAFGAETKVLYNKYENVEKLGENVYERDSGEIDRVLISVDGTQKMYYADPETGKKGVLYENCGGTLSMFVYQNDRYVVVQNCEYYQDDNGMWAARNRWYYYDYKNKVRARLFSSADDGFHWSADT